MDTHAATHTFAVLAAASGAVIDHDTFPTTASGLGRALSWIARRVGLASTLVVVEGTGSYGAILTERLELAGHRVVEAALMPAGDRRGVGKSDTLDAARIARAVLGLATDELQTPRTHSGGEDASSRARVALADSLLSAAKGQRGGLLPADRSRAVALRAWTSMLAGQYAEAHAHLAELEPAPRDEPWVWGLRVGLARRQDDVRALARYWVDARGVLVGHPVDLYSLLPLGEIGLAAARMGETELAEPLWTRARDLLEGLGTPPLWAPAFHWYGVQAAILTNRPKAMAPHAAVLVAAARTSPFAAALARAGRTWIAVLGRHVDPTQVEPAARGLASVGQLWEGARLAGHAAARADDRKDAATLLECARDLLASTTSPDPGHTPPSASKWRAGAVPLSRREREVVELVLSGMTLPADRGDPLPLGQDRRAPHRPDQTSQWRHHPVRAARPAVHQRAVAGRRGYPGTPPMPPAVASGVSDRPLTLSVLDLVPVRADQSTGDALAATVALAQTADDLGYRRYWLAEHHNMPAVAATNPAILIAMVAAATERIRVGSGGVMLPNHAPLVVAEQFALLEAAHPGRIDLGIGRAPGSDPVTSWALRHGAGGVEADAVTHFPEYVQNVVAMMKPGGVGLDLGGQQYVLHATPRSSSVPRVWLLGSSDYSAHLAAELGLPYVFAHHFSGQGTAEALDAYRREFRPSEAAAAPTTFLTVNVCVADTEEEAQALARPQVLAMVALRTRGALRPQLSVEEAAAERLPQEHEALAASMLDRWLIGTPESVTGRLQDLAATYAVDEVMLHPVAGSPAGTDRRRAPARERTLELVAEAVGRPSVAVGAGSTSA